MDAGRGHLDGGRPGDPLEQVGSQVAAMPSCVGKIVAPSQNECPWMQSSATSSGIRSRVCAVSSCASTDPLGGRVQDRPDVQVEHQVLDAALGVELHHLPDLLLERHAPDEVGDAICDGEAGVLVRRVHEDVPGSDRFDDDVCGTP